MSSKWRKIKLAVRNKLCVSVSAASESPPSGQLSGDKLIYPATSSRLFRLSKSFSISSSKKTCSICLETMKPGDGHAIFTAECSDSFHFHCIASNVRHGNHVCPICRAKWKEIPFDVPIPDHSLRGKQTTINPLDKALTTMYRRMPISPCPITNRNITPLLPQFIEPAVFNDDECLNHESPFISPTLRDRPITGDNCSFGKVKIETYPEVPAVPQLSARENFTVLINLKAPASFLPEENAAKMNLQTTRAPIDLVTVLDISGSMAGTKLALLKRAMGFVIQNLGLSDRLSVIAFSSTARRLFPLQRMSETGKQQALQAVNSLAANGGTNIAEGLRKGAKVMEDRKEKNPVAGIILLSDGQDTYTVTSCRATPTKPNHHVLLPLSIYGNKNLISKIPVHAFGFGIDHDASSMHSLSDASGGTFSFIETESVIQDAFAQCIGGLLSVVVKDLEVSVESVHPNLSLISLRVGSYPNRLTADRRTGLIDVGDLYAEEERDFLVSVSVPMEITANKTSLIKLRCVYNDPLTKKTVNIETEEVIIQRPEVVRQEMAVSIKVDRQRNRLEAADAMSRAKTAAEQKDLGSAVNILENCRKTLSRSESAKANDELCVALDLEMKEMQERMASMHTYEASGRAYILSGLSSHSWQRATARSDSSLIYSYQTPSMTEMVNRSQASTLLASPSGTRKNLISPKVG